MSRSKPSQEAKELAVLLAGSHVGTVRQLTTGKLAFEYDPSWIESDTGLPLSLSMPLVSRTHGDAAISAFMWGLLPDNERVLDGLSKKFQCSARSPFALLRETGEDCAGAVQFVRPDRLEALEADDGDVEWLTEAEVADRIRLLRQDAASVGRKADDPGSFSLAGAQPKTALLQAETGRWGIPAGRMPTTHILKPSTIGLAGHVENEHFCQVLARAAGFNAAVSTIETFEDQVVIASRRYDRRRTPDGRIVRVHQEDLCQTLAAPPWQKYERDGGPGPARIMNEVLAYSSRAEVDRAAFMNALAFNFVILGTDAHAKNYSCLLGTRNAVRLAPLYDVASVLPYPHIRDDRNMKLAMSVDGKYVPDDIMPRHWERLAQRASYDPQAVLGSLGRFVRELPDLAVATAASCRGEGLDDPVLDDLVDGIAARCAKLARHYAPLAEDAPARDGPTP